MIKKRKLRELRKLMSLLLTASLIVICGSGISAFAKNINMSTGEEQITDGNSEINIKENEDSKIYNGIIQKRIKKVHEVQLSLTKDLPRKAVSTMGQNPVGVINGVLTADDSEEMHFFNVTKSCLFLMGLNSNNTDYYAQLYAIDYSTQKATELNLKVDAGNQTGYNGLPAGDYMIYIGSSSGLGDSYNMSINTINKSGDLSIEYLGKSMENTLVYYSNGDIYSNGNFVFNVNNFDNSIFDWSRVFNLNFPGGGYHNREHYIQDVHVATLSLKPIVYTSNYASSTYALRVYLGAGTLFAYKDTVYYNGGPLESTTVDTTGLNTPRRLTDADSNNVLIFSLNGNKSIDLYGNLNYYYNNNIETATITDKED